MDILRQIFLKLYEDIVNYTNQQITDKRFRITRDRFFLFLERRIYEVVRENILDFPQGGVIYLVGDEPPPVVPIPVAPVAPVAPVQLDRQLELAGLRPQFPPWCVVCSTRHDQLVSNESGELVQDAQIGRIERFHSTIVPLSFSK